MPELNYFDTFGQFAKSAGAPGAPMAVSTPVPQPPEYQAAMAGLKDMPYYGMVGLGAGMAGAGIRDILTRLNRRINPMPAVYPGAVTTDMPIRRRRDAKEAAVTAPAISPTAAPSSPGMGEQFVNMLSHTGLGKIYAKQNFPWYYPMGMAATGLSAAAGWKGVEALSGMQQRHQQAAVTEKAKHDFEQALLENSDPGKSASEKTAAQQLGEVLDGLYAELSKKHPQESPEKLAVLGGWTDPQTYKDIANQLGSMYGALWAVPAAGLAAGAGYAYGNKGSRRAILAKAMDRRMRASYQRQPSSILAVPRDVPGGAMDDGEDTNLAA